MRIIAGKLKSREFTVRGFTHKIITIGNQPKSYPDTLLMILNLYVNQLVI